tara:strand:+ start:716 stop:1690 length:975 start_codon:yes stop_codon:yes gene_type:complete
MVGKITSDKLLSASQIATLMGESPFKTRNELLKEKLYHNYKGYDQPPETPETEIMQWGNRLEPIILQESAKLLGCKVNTEITEVYSYGDNFLECSLDGILNSINQKKIYPTDHIFLPQGKEYIEMQGKGIIEAKNTRSFFTAEPPSWRGVWQLQAQFLCCPWAYWGVIATLYQGSHLALYVYEPDAEMQKQILDACDDFYKRLKQPDFYPSDSVQEAASAYPLVEEDLPCVDLAGNDSSIAEDYYEAKKAQKEMAQLVEQLEAEIIDKMGMHQKGVFNNDLGVPIFTVERKMRHYKAQPEKIIPAKPARSERQKSLTFKTDWSL